MTEAFGIKHPTTAEIMWYFFGRLCETANVCMQLKIQRVFHEKDPMDIKERERERESDLLLVAFGSLPSLLELTC